jgi:hypothetical protein
MPKNKLFAALLLISVVSSCRPMSLEEQFVRQKIPVEIQNGKTVRVEIHSLSGNGNNDVGIRCSPELWNFITNSTKELAVQLKDSSKPDTSIDAVNLGGGGDFLGYLTNVHYLFRIGGPRHAQATVEITFPNGPDKPTPAEIIVGKTVIDTKPLGS